MNENQTDTTIILLSSGEYDTYASRPYRVLKPFTVRVTFAEFMAQWMPHPERPRKVEPYPSDFDQWLCDTGHIAEIVCHEVYTGGNSVALLDESVADIVFAPPA